MCTINREKAIQLRRQADEAWEAAKFYEGGRNRFLEERLKKLSGELHDEASKIERMLDD